MHKITTSSWDPQYKLIRTHISGTMEKSDIDQWAGSLHAALNEVAADSSFRIFVNLHGFKAANFEAHKHFREIIPLTLASYGWRVGYLDLFEEAKDLPVTYTRGIRCEAAAHVHQDETKIALYEQNYSRQQEHFFTDPVMAEKWISEYNATEEASH